MFLWSSSSALVSLAALMRREGGEAAPAPAQDALRIERGTAPVSRPHMVVLPPR